MIPFLIFLLQMFTSASDRWPEVPALRVMGIAQDGGYPQAGCMRSCCLAVWSAQRPAQEVASVALLDPTTKSAWLIDATPDFRKQLHTLQQRGYHLRGIVLTHAHMGHYTGLMHLGREAMGTQAVPVYALPRMRAFLQNNGPWNLLIELGHITLYPLEAGQAVPLGPFQLTPLLVPHRDEYSETAGFRIRGPQGKQVVYIPDIDKWEQLDSPIESVIEQVEIALLDGTFFDGDELPGRDMRDIPHPFLVESMARFDTCALAFRQKIYFIHFNHTNPVLDPTSPAARLLRSKGYHLAKAGIWWPL